MFDEISITSIMF